MYNKDMVYSIVWHNPQTLQNFEPLIYPVPQKAPHVSAGMNVMNFPEGQRPKATNVSPWYGVYSGSTALVSMAGRYIKNSVPFSGSL